MVSKPSKPRAIVHLLDVQEIQCANSSAPEKGPGRKSTRFLLDLGEWISFKLFVVHCSYDMLVPHV